MFSSYHVHKLTHITPLFYYPQRLFHSSKPFSSSQRDFYQILGVSRTATATEIKSSYYRLAQLHHPDKNPSVSSKDKFSEINNAYETLIDESKRKAYDAYESPRSTSNQGSSYSSYTSYKTSRAEEDFFAEFLRKGGGRSGSYYDDIIFEEFSKWQDMDSEVSEWARIRGQNIVLDIEVTFEESIHGTKKEVNFERKEICGTCEGKKHRTSAKPHRCNVCGGRGTMKIGGSFIPFGVPCSNCKGSGTVYKNTCNGCEGRGVQSRKVTDNIVVPKGVCNGENVRIKGKGDTGQNGGYRGDLIAKVAVKPSTYYRRKGMDVFTDLYVHASQAILGGTIMVDTLYGQKKVEITKGTQIGDNIKIPRMGVTKGNATGYRGDHYVEVKVFIPTEISEEDTLLYQKISEMEEKRDEAEKMRKEAQNREKEAQEEREYAKKQTSYSQRRKNKAAKIESSESEDDYGDYTFAKEMERELKKRFYREQLRKNKNPFCVHKCT